ncbi:rod shape-determining protein MreC [Phaeobacter gallaeciensis]|uniref:Cell shape-determining protein MreC n=1 Tax=Phaeobacter gallaeciensis TaxID=60890 RepID=A0A1B0ZVB3_9RHOB|nr:MULTISPECIES: rod shape-determining protein MreC [Phaeobacter]MDF1773073.1 rod shape-determining protein MreC [Pseudophaeobacter sp. bin_em_oilr2.035]MEE2633670.1 rod shape-determining protein MreC [Pseudomonadota bacterium]ANP38038.1 rod shape-determining protein MreC [Phaeobacter gallaeciensis]MDE4060515.1 rod shape-determining protein MreC [Phaeobacter gallaeciensis]MDE4099858.1 rod shape-determining protein MreC [Phaeobacter gallaeciensis]
MAKDRSQREDYSAPLRRLLIGLVCLCLAAIFLVWRIDSPRVERFRAQLVNTVVPNMDWAMVPVTATVNLFRDFQSYQRLSEQNQELRSELRQMRAWKEAALQLEQENARLLDLNNVRLDPKLTYITGVVMADSGSPFRQSVILNIGARDGIQDGWAAMDGIGLVGRISGTGQDTARVILLTDAASAVPATIQPSGQTVLVTGDNSAAPVLDFLENPDLIRPGDRVITSGDGSVFPPGLLIGQVTEDRTGRKRVRLSADYERLEFLRVLRHQGSEVIKEPGGLVVPAPDATVPLPRPQNLAPEALSASEGESNG